MIVRRGVLTDHYVEGDRSVVMVEESVLGLSPVATAILEAVRGEDPVSLQAVTRHVVATFGPPDEPASAEELTRQQIWDLAAHKVLVVVEDSDVDEDSTQTGQRQHESAREGSEAAVTALRDALRHVRSTAPEQWTLPVSVGAVSFVAAARRHHVVPYLAAHLDRLVLPRRATSELEASAGGQRAGAKVLAADLSVALSALDSENVRALAVKGVALASQAYGDYAARGAGDLDLLVAPEDVAPAHRALTAAGWTSPSAYPPPGESWAWRHFIKTGNELSLTSDMSIIDLHWHLVPTRSTFPAFDVLWSRRDVVSVDGRPVPTLSRYDALTHSAGHAAKDSWRWLRSLLDVHVLTSDRDTWSLADRPLRPDQLRSIGLSALEFGVLPGAPEVVHQAARLVDGRFLERVRDDQSTTAAEHRPLSTPGLQLVRRLRTIKLTRGSVGESARLLSRTVLPPWLTAQETSPWAFIAIPRVLRRRTSEVVSRFGVPK